MAARRIPLPAGTDVALVLQGGGALGAYQAGIYQGICETRLEPNWVAGISIGALNAAIIAGNKPQERVAKLREFWDTISAPNWLPSTTMGLEAQLAESGPIFRSWLDTMEAWRAMMEGQRGFYRPRSPLAMTGIVVDADPGKVSYYDTGPMIETLNSLVDFGRINDGEMRVSVGAVNVRTGELEYFDNRKTTLSAEHFLASGALPPAFPAVEIGGDYYWDGGIVSNTPLTYVMQNCAATAQLIFQIDLWNPEGALPQTLLDVSERTKEIQYASRTRNVTRIQRMQQHYNRVIRELLEEVPNASNSDNPWIRHAAELASDVRTTLVHLTYQEKAAIGHFKDYQFGRVAINEHIAAGLRDINEIMGRDDWFELPSGQDTFVLRSLDETLRTDEETP